MDWITTVNGLIALITGLAGLIGTGVSAFFAVKAWIKAIKEKSHKEIWAMIMQIADAAMVEAEKSVLHGEDKKQMVINMVKASCKTANIDVELFIDQVDQYIEQAIAFFNNMNK